MRRRTTVLAAAIVAVTALAGCGQDPAPAADHASQSPTASPAPPATAPPTSSAPAPAGDPVIVAAATPEAAVAALVTVLGGEFEPRPDGTDLATPTLSRCGWEYESERRRTARQAIVRGGGADGPVPNLSVEAVAYDGEDAARLALEELRAATGTCPSGEAGYTQLSEEEQVGLTEDRVAVAYTTSGGDSGHLVVVRRGVVVAIVDGRDLTSVDATARTLSLHLGNLPASAAGAG